MDDIPVPIEEIPTPPVEVVVVDETPAVEVHVGVPEQDTAAVHLSAGTQKVISSLDKAYGRR